MAQLYAFLLAKHHLTPMYNSTAERSNASIYSKCCGYFQPDHHFHPLLGFFLICAQLEFNIHMLFTWLAPDEIVQRCQVWIGRGGPVPWPPRSLAVGQNTCWLWRVKNFVFSTSSRPTVESTQLPIQWVSRALYPGVKRPGREADHSPPASAEVKKIQIYTST
jgi:hypothetical protein